MRRWALVLLAALFGVGGCTTHAPIHGEDSNVATLFFRAGFPLQKAGPRRIEIAGVQVTGRFTDNIQSGDPSFDGQEFSVPAALKGKAMLTSVSVRAVEPALFLGGAIGVEMGVGGGFISSDITLQDGVARAHNREYDNAVSGSLALLTRWIGSGFGARLGIESTVAVNHTLVQQELLAIYTYSPAVELLAGVRSMTYERSSDVDSDLRLEFSGPAAGLRINF